MNRPTHQTPRRRFYWFHIETVCFLLLVSALVVSFRDAFRAPETLRVAPTGFRMEFRTASASEKPDWYFGLHDDPFVPDVGEPPETDAERDAWTVQDLTKPVPAQEPSPIRFPVSGTEVSVSPAPPLFSRPNPRVEAPYDSDGKAERDVEMTLFYASEDGLPAIVIEDDDVSSADVPAAEARAYRTGIGLPGTNTIFRTIL